MMKTFAIGLICWIGIFISQISFAMPPINTHTSLKEKAENALLNGDTLEACIIFRQLKTETDSIARIHYQSEIKAKRATYQIDKLYLENKLQRGVILRRISLFLLISVLLLASAFYFLRKSNHQLEEERIKAKKLKEAAEFSLQKKSKLLYAISNDMTDSLNAMKEITTELQTENSSSLQDIKGKISCLRNSAEKLQNIYHQIFS
ncbi:MAG: hypothetical protein RRX93_01675 [Bacteroidales bacterium]